MTKCKNCGKETDNEAMFGEVWCEDCEGELHEKIDRNMKTRQVRHGEF